MADSILDTDGVNIEASTASTESAPVETVQSIYGDTKVEWPEGFPEELRNEPSLKPFVTKEGKVDVNNLAKSYYNTKKEFGRPKAVLPSENATKEELDEFYQKLNGYDPVYENYKLDVKTEESPLHETFIEGIRKFAHDNRLPMSTAKSLYDMMEKTAKEDIAETAQANQAMMEENLGKLKQEWGEAYTPRVEAAKRLITDYMGHDESLKEAFKQPDIGNNPLIIKMLGTISSKLYEEGKFHGQSNSINMTPEDVEAQISAVYNDAKHPFHHSEMGGEHKKAMMDMQKLFELRAKYRK